MLTEKEENETMDLSRSLYQVLLDAQITETDIDSHFSDLYLRVTPENTELLRQYYEAQGIKKMPKTFRSNTSDGCWYDIPFAYNPYWEEKMRRIDE